ncbi:MAG: protein kinase [Chloroflexi bacterium]|nr:protein kinase [Chloroflexota bacterium]MBP6803435.1 protein kinase [Chloroflexota bacterium]MBP7593693.1 protein kinase [Chloroflexota bacterium]
MNNIIGQQIDTYRIEARLGAGGMGAVYRAYDMALARRVALKIMHEQFASQPQFQRRFMQEAQAIARLSHPAIVIIHRFDNKQGYLYIVMEYVNGLSLGAYIKQLAQRNQVMLLSETAHIIAQVADALGYAHRQGVVHRDIKPDNVIIKPLDQPEREGEPAVRSVVTDFGLAKLLQGGIETQSGTFMGTLPYMSPEQALAKDVDGRSDIYSLGVVLYQLATGKLPFDIQTPTEAVLKHLNEVPPPPRTLQPGLPAALEAVIIKSLAKEPADRYQTGEAMAQALRAAAAGLTPEDVTVFKTAAASNIVSLMTQLETPGNMAEPSQWDVAAAAPGAADRLIIAQENETNRPQDLNKKSLVIGRTDENDVVLPGKGVSRRHARLEKTAVGWQVIDLGSTNGTFLEGSKLLPDVAENWAAGETLRIGSFHLQWQAGQKSAVPQPGIPLGGQTYQATMPISATPGSSQIQSSSGQLGMVVHPTHVDVTPGQRADMQVELFNQGMTVDHFNLNMEGLPANWVTLPTESLQLMPGARGSQPVAIHPPADSTARSGQHRYRLVVTSRSDQKESAAVSGSVTVKPFTRFSLDMRPKRLKSSGACRLLIRNDGNFDTTFNVVGRDPGEAITFHTPHTRIPIAAGNSSTLDLVLAAKKRPFLGQKQTLPFEVQVSTASSDQQSISGQLDVTPIIPAWVPGVLMALLVILCIALVAGYAYVNQQNQAAQATVEAIANAQVAATQTQEALVSAASLGTRGAEEAAAATATSLAATAVAQGDDDGDGLSNQQELSLGTLPNNPDTDGDGLNDGAEVNQFGTQPKNKDTDGDTLPDGAEVNDHKTSPTNPDTDNDGTPDGIEVAAGSNPLLPPTATPTLTPQPDPVTPTFTPTPSVTPETAVGPWDGVWASTCAYLECSDVTLNQADGSETVTGSFQAVAGSGTLVGIVEEDRLTGTWSLNGSNGTFDFWLAPDGNTWQGNWDRTAGWCATRDPGVFDLPVPCGLARWYGDWTTTYETLTIVQHGVDFEGTYANGQGTVSGTIDGTLISGNWFRNGSSGTLEYFMIGNGEQFNGNWDDNNAWCGQRSGAPEPSTCLNQGNIIFIPPIIMVTLQPNLPILPIQPIFIPTPTP